MDLMITVSLAWREDRENFTIFIPSKLYLKIVTYTEILKRQ